MPETAQKSAQSTSDILHTTVLIAGGGPCGLMLANELGRRGVQVLLVDDKPGTAVNPQANATQARTMEYYRRLGFADEIRALGLPADHPTDVAYFTRYAGHELARIKLPTAREAARLSRELGGSWSAAELPHRVSQKFVEPVLRRHAQALPGVTLRASTRLLSFAQDAQGVQAKVQDIASGTEQAVQASYLVGADGARSVVRRALGFDYTGHTGTRRSFMGGRMHAVYLRASELIERLPHPRAWMYCSFNADRRAFMACVDGVQEFAFHTQLRDDESDADISDADARRMFIDAVGTSVDIEILSRCSWTAGHALVSAGMGAGRVFIGGDAAHLFTPTGGLGYNTAVEDAVNLGWKIAAVVHGHAHPALLDSYALERLPVARRNTAYAQQFADSVGLLPVAPELEEDGPAGQRARAAASTELNRHARLEFNIPGVTFGARVDGSPVIVSDGTQPPADAANHYQPSACPGGRAPHAWLADGRSLYDLFGLDWVLLTDAPAGAAAQAWRHEAERRKLPMRVIGWPDPAAQALYEADHALIRPDQIVAWRGRGETGQAGAVLDQVLGFPARAD